MPQYVCNKRVIFVVSDEGDHRVPNSRWYDYLLTRSEAPTPRKVVIVDNLDVTPQTHLVPEERVKVRIPLRVVLNNAYGEDVKRQRMAQKALLFGERYDNGSVSRRIG